MHRDPYELSRLLQGKRHMLFDVDDWGHSLLHFSALWPVGIVLLLRHGAAPLANQKDVYGRLPLSYATESLRIAEANSGNPRPYSSVSWQDLRTSTMLL